MKTIALWLLGVAGTPSDETPALAPAVQETDRPAVAAADLKALRDANIFSPNKPSRKSGGSRSSGSGNRTSAPPAPPPKPGPPVVTGIFLDAPSKAYQAIIEDRNPEGLRKFSTPKFVKGGETVEGIRIQTVTANRVNIEHGGTTRALGVGDSLPEPEAPKPVAPAPAPAPGSDPAAPEPAPPPAPQDEATKNEAIETLKKKIRKNRPESPE